MGIRGGEEELVDGIGKVDNVEGAKLDRLLILEGYVLDKV